MKIHYVYVAPLCFWIEGEVINVLELQPSTMLLVNFKNVVFIYSAYIVGSHQIEDMRT